MNYHRNANTGGGEGGVGKTEGKGEKMAGERTISLPRRKGDDASRFQTKPLHVLKEEGWFSPRYSRRGQILILLPKVRFLNLRIEIRNKIPWID